MQRERQDFHVRALMNMAAGERAVIFVISNFSVRRVTVNEI